MGKPTIISLFPIQETISSYNYLVENFNIVTYSLTTKTALINDMKNDPYVKALAIFGSYPGFNSIGGLNDEDLIDSLPPNLKVIGLCSAGYDGYNLSYLNEKGIRLCNVPVDYHVGMDVADCALWHVLSGVRKFSSWDNKIHNSINIDQHTLKIRDEVRNEFSNEKEAGFAFGHMFHGQPIKRSGGRKCVVFGYGLIGKFVVERMLTIGMNVHVLVRNPSKYSKMEQKIKFYSSSIQEEIDEATLNADVLIICLPGGKETNHIINTHMLENVNNNSIIVNVGRGSCIDTVALKRAIEIGKVSHVGLDVFPNEPIIENYWFNETLINEKSNDFFTSTITPHLGSGTLNTLEYATEECISNLIKAIENNEYINIVN
jgi:lactate dehydrogenase-like 2-hydroxyacid dehydrogenase